MKFDEFKTRFSELISKPDEIQANAVDFLKDVEADYNTLDSVNKQVETDTEKIRSLQDTNQKLFLAVTGTPDESEEEKEDNPIDWDALEKENE